MADGFEQILPWLAALSVVSLVATPVLAMFVIVRLPASYFTRQRRPPRDTAHSALGAALLATKNTLGALLVIAGIAMLVLPGQGLITILAGLALMNFPGKYELERRIVSRPAIRKALGWIRRKAGKPPLRLDGFSRDS